MTQSKSERSNENKRKEACEKLAWSSATGEGQKLGAYKSQRTEIEENKNWLQDDTKIWKDCITDKKGIE